MGAFKIDLFVDGCDSLNKKLNVVFCCIALHTPNKHLLMRNGCDQSECNKHCSGLKMILGDEQATSKVLKP